MDFEKPVVIFVAIGNIQAYQVYGILVDAGIQCHVVEDASYEGIYLGTLATSTDRPKIWIDQADVERAKPILEEFAARLSSRLDTEEATLDNQKPILVTCERCGKTSEFPSAQKGSVQRCRHCKASVDVGEDDSGIEGWDEYEPEE